MFPFSCSCKMDGRVSPNILVKGRPVRIPVKQRLVLKWIEMDRNAFILLATGRDRPGIVDRISGAIYDGGCNLEDSRMSILGGEFALIVLVTGQSANLSRIEDALRELAPEFDLTLEIKRAESVPPGDVVKAAIPFRVSAVSMDHPGIVHKISRFLSQKGINVVRLDTRLTHAPVTGTPIFSLELEAHIPTDLPLNRLRKELGDLAEEENIDIELHAAD